MPHAYPPTSPQRVTRSALVLAVCLALANVFAQGVDPLVGTFSDGWLQLTVTGGGGQYSGTIVVGGQTYPFVAQGSVARIDGLYEMGGQRYPFSAALQGDVMLLVNGNQTFQLARQAGQAPAQQAPAQQAPAQQAAAPAPGGFLPPGTRLSYRQAVASNPGTNAGPDARAVGGHGIIQIDIHYSDAQLCVAKLTMYTAGVMVDSLTQTASETILGEGGLCSTYWAPPAVLAQYQAPPGGIQTVQRGPFELGGRSYDALYIASEFENNRVTRVYDLASGVLLSEVEGSGQRGYAAGGNPERASSGVQELVNIRQVSLPWSLAEALPASVQNVRSFTYRGEYITSTPGVYMWDSSFRMPYETTSTVQQRGVNYLVLQNSTVMSLPGTTAQQPPSQSQTLLTAASGHFLPLAVIPTLSVGQVLDVDPVTGIRTYVERADAGGIVIVNEGKGQRGMTLFDASSGLALQSQIDQQTDGQNVTVTQQLVGVQ